MGRTNVVPGSNGIKLVEAWSPNNIQDKVKLVTTIATREQWTSGQEPGMNGSYGPSMYRSDGMISGARYQRVATCFDHHANFFATRDTGLHTSGPSEVTVGIQQKVCRLEITVHNVRTED